jgi:hypothetical protein
MKPFKNFVGVAIMAGALLALIASIGITPKTSRADVPTSKSCLQSQGMQTQILDESTILATNGNASALIKVSGCRLDSSKVLVFEYRGTTHICNRLDVGLQLMTSTGSGLGFPETCFIDEVENISKEQAKDIKMKAKSSN